MRKIRVLTLSLAFSATSFAEERPAVRMLPAKPMDVVEAVTARAAPEIGYDPLGSPRPNSGPRTMFDNLKPGDEPKEPGRWTKFTKWMDDRAKAVKKAVNSPPPQPEPRVGQVNTQAAPPKLFGPKPAQPPQVPKVASAEPAYRWYGWGTATPGANRFAPTGDYPMGSAQWYQQTGATPGAFPIPTMNPYRPAPGSDLPVYMPPPQIPVNVPQPTPVKTTVSKKTIAETPAYIPRPLPTSPTVPIPTVAVPAMPPEMRKPAAPKSVEPSWKPAPAEAPKGSTEPSWKPAEAPVIRGQEPQLDDSPLLKAVNAASQGLVRNLTIRETGPGQLTIAFQSTTPTLAEMAVKSISSVQELKPYTIEFEGKVSQ